MNSGRVGGANTPLRVGLIVNPIAGVGGEVGLTGSDGEAIQASARSLGGQPRSPERARRFVDALTGHCAEVELLVASGALGEDHVAAEVPTRLVGSPQPVTGTGLDTVEAARSLAREGVAILVFVGGDGTARDVLAGVNSEQLCLGVPAGVKMHSGVFAVTPEEAAAQIAQLARGQVRARLRDVVDIDEAARRRGRLSTSVYGAMLVPSHERIQRGKRSPAAGASLDAVGVAHMIRHATTGHAVLFGPGTTVQSVAREFGFDSSLLGFDVLTPEGTVLKDMTGRGLETVVEQYPDFSVVLSPVGGQGFIIGRGNHQLTAPLLEQLEPARLLLIADAPKLGELAGRLHIDAPTLDLNDKFRGFARVLLGHGDTAVVRIC